MLTNRISFVHFKCIELFVHLSTYLQPGIPPPGVFLQEKSQYGTSANWMHGALFRVRRFTSNGDRRARLTAHTTVWFCSSCLWTTREERRPSYENLHSLLSTCRWQASRRRLCCPYGRNRITVDPISPREWGRHPSTVGDLESQLLDYDNLIHLSALVVSAAWV